MRLGRRAGVWKVFLWKPSIRNPIEIYCIKEIARILLSRPGQKKAIGRSGEEGGGKRSRLVMEKGKVKN
jgi:hypothetical protein